MLTLLNISHLITVATTTTASSSQAYSISAIYYKYKSFVIIWPQLPNYNTGSTQDTITLLQLSLYSIRATSYNHRCNFFIRRAPIQEMEFINRRSKLYKATFVWGLLHIYPKFTSSVKPFLVETTAAIILLLTSLGSKEDDENMTTWCFFHSIGWCPNDSFSSDRLKYNQAFHDFFLALQFDQKSSNFCILLAFGSPSFGIFVCWESQSTSLRGERVWIVLLLLRSCTKHITASYVTPLQRYHQGLLIHASDRICFIIITTSPLPNYLKPRNICHNFPDLTSVTEI